MSGAWPFPGEVPVVRARRVAQAYRAALEQVSPETMTELDARMKAWGELWVVPRIITWGPNDELTSAQAGEVLCTSADSINALRRRGRLPGIRQPDGSYRYKASEVARLSAEPRTRRTRHTTDTLTTDGRSAPS